MLVIDGNMKNRRDICAASEAGFTEYEGLPGSIKTGCQLSPGYQSKYCYEHTPRISPMTAREDQTLDCAKEGIVRLITAKKQTRSETYYQVHGIHDYLSVCVPADSTINMPTFFQVAWLGQEEQMTWEPASTLPQVLINEFESGMVSTGQMITDTKFGVVNHTLVVTTSSATGVSPAKKLKTSVLHPDPGY